MQSFRIGEEKYTYMVQLCSAIVDEALTKANIYSKPDESCPRTA